MLSQISKSLSEYSKGHLSFEKMALLLARFQYDNNEVYRDYCSYLGVKSGDMKNLDSIVYLPIDAFKQYRVITEVGLPTEQVFGSSGTTGSQRSMHYMSDLRHYLVGAQQLFESTYGGLKDFTIFGLLPNYLERNDSSLVAMVDWFIKQSKGGGFFLDDFDALTTSLDRTKGKVLLIGVSFALLDYGQASNLNNPELTIMETGGMKGRRKEMTKQELHKQLAKDFNTSSIHSEYGMTELSSQCYSKGNGIFEENPMMKVRIREITDPYAMSKQTKSGVVQVIDLNNIYSCAFIETHDVGRKLSKDTFEILGRLDNADLRGCNLLIS